jgi:MYXO-CTERM domain-containing protein
MKFFKPRLLLLAIFVFGFRTAAAQDLILANFGSDVILRVDDATRVVTPFASHPTMDGPTAMAFNTAGQLLVLNEFSHNVLAFDRMTGSFLSTLISPSALSAVGLTDPGDMEVGADGALYLTSHFNTGTNIWKFDPLSGAFLGSFAFSPPTHHTHGLALGTGGNWYQGNVDTMSIESFNGLTGASMGPFAFHPDMFPIADLAFGSTFMYVTIDGDGGVMRFDAGSGAFAGFLIPGGPAAGHWGILVDGDDLFVANKSSGLIKRYNATTGVFVEDYVSGVPAVFDMLRMSAIPEPGSWFLAGLAVAGLLARRQPRRRVLNRSCPPQGPGKGPGRLTVNRI